MPGNLTKLAAAKRLVELGVAPRVLDLELAAAYVGLSAEAFLKSVKNGVYPAPLRDGRRRQWDRVALDRAVDARSALHTSSRKQEAPEDLDRAIDAA